MGKDTVYGRPESEYLSTVKGKDTVYGKPESEYLFILKGKGYGL
jgi:hypothetical protein